MAAQSDQVAADEFVQVIAAIILAQQHALGRSGAVDGFNLADDIFLRSSCHQDGYIGVETAGILAQHLDQRVEAGGFFQLVQAVNDEQILLCLIFQRLDEEKFKQTVVIQLLQLLKAPVAEIIAVRGVGLRQGIGQVFQAVLDVAGLGPVKHAHVDGADQLPVLCQMAHEGCLACAGLPQDDKQAAGDGIVQHPALALLPEPFAADEIIPFGHGDELIILQRALDL